MNIIFIKMNSKIIIDNVEFSFDDGCRVLKLKEKECPVEELQDFWDDIVPMNFVSIAKMPNLEQRRIALLYLDMNDLIKDVNPELIDSKTIEKQTTWINKDGKEELISFNDKYELYSVNNRDLGLSTNLNSLRHSYSYYVKFKDTSTDREYMIWVDLNDIIATNCKKPWISEDEKRKIASAIDAIAWTITTDVSKGCIEQIVRQGDCILIKPTLEYKKESSPRHLTGEEYLEFLKLES